MPSEQPPSIPIQTPSFNWDNVNFHDQWKLFSEQCNFLLINNGPFSKHSDPVHIAPVLNWLGPKSYQVFSNLKFDEEGKEKSKIHDIVYVWKAFQTNPVCTPIVVPTWFYIFKPM